MSNTEVEYKTLANLIAEGTWLQALLTELQIPSLKHPVLWCDNLSTIMLSSNPLQHARTKHIEPDLYFLREKVLQRRIEVKHITSQDQVADILTKALSSSRLLD